MRSGCNRHEQDQKRSRECERAILSMAHQLAGLSLRKWLEYLAAVLIGNAVYYYSFMPHMPPALQHQGFRIDWGWLLDFGICVAIYGLIRLGARIQRRNQESNESHKVEKG
ncbi:MAG: hypothetical protein ACRD4K_14005 [Candidatus Acidiferrales bacterium]